MLLIDGWGRLEVLPQSFAPMTEHLQPVRHDNLKRLIAELAADGVHSDQERGQILGRLRGEELARLLQGAPISDAIAREMEWAMHRPTRWMDQTHDPLTMG